MRKLWDFDCECGARFEDTVEDDEQVACPTCGSLATERVSGGRSFKTIVPTYPGALKNKAGYVHSHGDKPAEKGNSFSSVPSKASL
jgi:DNA-directed RNA polymerase subunit RPC12/RpoP